MNVLKIRQIVSIQSQSNLPVSVKSTTNQDRKQPEALIYFVSAKGRLISTNMVPVFSVFKIKMHSLLAGGAKVPAGSYTWHNFNKSCSASVFERTSLVKIAILWDLTESRHT